MMDVRFYEIRPTDIRDDRLLARTMTLEDARTMAKSLCEDGPVRIIRCGDGWTEGVETVRADKGE